MHMLYNSRLPTSQVVSSYMTKVQVQITRSNFYLSPKATFDRFKGPKMRAFSWIVAPGWFQYVYSAPLTQACE